MVDRNQHLGGLQCLPAGGGRKYLQNVGNHVPEVHTHTIHFCENLNPQLTAVVLTQCLETIEEIVQSESEAPDSKVNMNSLRLEEFDVVHNPHGHFHMRRHVQILCKTREGFLWQQCQ